MGFRRNQNFYSFLVAVKQDRVGRRRHETPAACLACNSVSERDGKIISAWPSERGLYPDRILEANELESVGDMPVSGLPNFREARLFADFRPYTASYSQRVWYTIRDYIVHLKMLDVRLICGFEPEIL
ncbi:hypothetical protein C8R32_1282 [Nitrosospira sp. Nsp5]|uniref:Uncharacterized protein n=1 Tax=Nitrosospira multiformis TaxID=1231 RepID=A0ABY0T683_9PROT|nr:hypothetical protein C8R32_1282 [Nitrosospira sp. Nsp5]SDQ31397.1 hypothetical protein SAMN05216402_0328 [Nitrosospira multiformis]